MVWIRRLVWRLVVFLARLEALPRTEFEQEFETACTKRQVHKTSAIHYSVQLKTHSRLCISFAQLLLRNSVCWLKSFSNYQAIALRLAIYDAARKRGHILAGENHSCHKSDAKIEGLSNAEKVDANQPISDALKPCQKSSHSAVTGGNLPQNQRRFLI